MQNFDNPSGMFSTWREVGHLSRPKLIRRAILNLAFSIGLLFFLRGLDYRLSTTLFRNDRILPVFLFAAALYGILEAMSLLWLIPSGRCFLRAGRDGIWFKQPPGGYPFGPAKEVVVRWTDLKRCTPFTARMNGIAHTQFIGLEVVNHGDGSSRKHMILTHPYKENLAELVADLRGSAG